MDTKNSIIPKEGFTDIDGTIRTNLSIKNPTVILVLATNRMPRFAFACLPKRRRNGMKKFRTITVHESPFHGKTFSLR